MSFIPTAEASHSGTLNMPRRSVIVFLPSIVSRQSTRPSAPHLASLCCHFYCSYIETHVDVGLTSSGVHVYLHTRGVGNTSLHNSRAADSRLGSCRDLWPPVCVDREGGMGRVDVEDGRNKWRRNLSSQHNWLCVHTCTQKTYCCYYASLTSRGYKKNTWKHTESMQQLIHLFHIIPIPPGESGGLIRGLHPDVSLLLFT